MKILSLLAAVAVLAASEASAQGYGNPNDPASGPPRGAPSGGGPSDIHSALRLTPAQEPAWAALNAVARPDPQRQATMREEMGRLPQMTTPQRLDVTQAEMQRDAQDFARRATAIRKFYAQLSPAQQATFDRLTGPPPGGGRGPPQR